MLIKREDRPLLVALLAIAFALFLNVSLSFMASPTIKEPKANSEQQPNAPPKNGGFPWESFWVFCTFGATGMLAVYAARTFADARKSNERQLRAYVIIDAGNVWDASGIGAFRANPLANPPPLLAPHFTNFITAMLTLKNTGQSPARNVLHWTKVTVSDPASEHLLIAPDILDEQQASVIGPGQTITKTAVTIFPLTQPVIDQIAVHQKAIHVYGKITYLDIFKRERTTIYNLRYSGIWPPIPGGNFLFALHGNDFD